MSNVNSGPSTNASGPVPVQTQVIPSKDDRLIELELRVSNLSRIIELQQENANAKAKYEHEAFERAQKYEAERQAKQLHMFEVWGPSALNLAASILAFAAGQKATKND